MNTVSFTVTAEYDGKKVLHFLRGGAGLSYHLVRSLKTFENGIMCNGVRVRTCDIIHEGDIITVNMQSKVPDIPAENIPLDIIYEDESLLAVNKPAGLAVHPTHNHFTGTLANGVVYYFEQQGCSVPFMAVGRLDKQTSGALVIARDAYACAKLQGRIEKTYIAVVQGELEKTGTIDLPIIRPDPKKTLRQCAPGGISAVTHFESIAYGDGYTAARVTLETGRTHQIRVHFASSGHPLLGDSMYGSTDTRISRAALHCLNATFLHPVTGEKITVTAPVPSDIQKFL
jgi:23S rRNA pseudouridine1911/1915/1917 synthase